MTEQEILSWTFLGVQLLCVVVTETTRRRCRAILREVEAAHDRIRGIVVSQQERHVEAVRERDSLRRRCAFLEAQLEEARRA